VLNAERTIAVARLSTRQSPIVLADVDEWSRDLHDVLCSLFADATISQLSIRAPKGREFKMLNKIFKSLKAVVGVEPA
jgi:hypothetical protein